MPVRKVKGGYQYGTTGKIYPDKASAERQGRAIRASQARAGKFESAGEFTTSFNDGHSHVAEVYINGMGKTISTSSGPDHVHHVSKWSVGFAGVHEHNHFIRKPDNA